jgi:nucleoside phosphorylase
MEALLSSYLNGLLALKSKVEKGGNDYQIISMLQMRLKENIEKRRIQSDTKDIDADRMVILSTANEITERLFDESFDDFCQLNASQRPSPAEGSVLMSQKLLSPCVVILTALSVEFQAVSAHIIPHKKDSRHRTVYWLGTFPSPGCLWKVSSVEIGPSNSIAAIKTTQAIQDFQPDVVLFVGVAGGLKDVHIGDVIAARKIYCYESGKDSTTFLPRPEIALATPRMESWARSVRNEQLWLGRIKNNSKLHSPSSPCAYVDAIAAGEKVVNSLDSSTAQLLRKQYSDALALEMEGYGFLRAAYNHPEVDALVIRGISDLLGGKSEADAANSQELASNHASAFAFELLAQLSMDQEFLAMHRARKAQEKYQSASRSEKSRSQQHSTHTYNIKNSGQMAIGPRSQIINHEKRIVE